MEDTQHQSIKKYGLLIAGAILMIAGTLCSIKTYSGYVEGNKTPYAYSLMFLFVAVVLTARGAYNAFSGTTGIHEADVKRLAQAGLLTALCYIGFAFFKIDITVGTEKTAFHFGNVFCVLAALFLGGYWGGLAGAIGMTIGDLTSSYVTSAPKTFLLKLLIGLIVSFYLLADSRRISRVCKKICYALAERNRADRMIYWTRKASRIFAGFTTGKIVDSLVVGIICYFMMLLMGLEYPLIISVVIGVTNVLPFFGPFIGAVPSILILLIVNPMSALKFAIFILILQQVDGNVIGPKILGDYTGISPLLTMAAILLGSGLLGFVGLIISVPLCALVYAMAQVYLEERLQKKGLPADTASYDGMPPEDPREEAPKEGYLERIRNKLRGLKK